MRSFALLLGLGLALAAVAPPAQAATARVSTCFCEGPISTKVKATNGFDGRNFNFPESAATYWFARVALPEGARLTLRGRYAKARYQSLASYHGDGRPLADLRDVLTRPDPGATNPFVPGARRDGRKRGYTVTVVGGDPPATGRAPNTLYAGAGSATATQFAYRVYLPDDRRDPAGGAGIPAMEVTLADGRTLTGADACAAVNHPDRSIPVVTTPKELWATLRAAPGCPPTFPAFPRPRWERFFSLEDGTERILAECQGTPKNGDRPADGGGYYSNAESRYLFLNADRRNGPVLVVDGKLPTYARTSARTRRMPTAQLRYWSICSYESRVTTRYGDCLADEDLALRRGRRYRIVVSRRADRPRNATARCGVTWLAWPARGDGAGGRDFAQLVIRNMVAAPGFKQAIQRVRTHGSEARTMGAYLPRSTYATKRGFERRGC